MVVNLSRGVYLRLLRPGGGVMARRLARFCQKRTWTRKGCDEAMAVLVTGGAGYIGGHMTLGLIDAGENVVVLGQLMLFPGAPVVDATKPPPPAAAPAEAKSAPEGK